MSLVAIAAAGPASMPMSFITAATASAGVGCARASSTDRVCSGLAPSSANLSRTACISGAGLAISVAVAAPEPTVLATVPESVCAIAPLGMVTLKTDDSRRPESERFFKR